MAKLLTLLAVYAVAQPISSRAGSSPPPQGVSEGAVYRVDLESGRLVATAIEPRPLAIPVNSTSRPQQPAPEVVQPAQKLHPRLIEWIEGGKPQTEKVSVVVAFKDTVRVPRFPSLDPSLPDDSAKNQQAYADAEALVRAIEEKRAPIYEQRRGKLEQYEAKTIETFWLIDGLIVEMPLGRVQDLARDQEVLSIAPVHSGERPPHDLSDRNDVGDGRTWIASDPYQGLASGGYIGLLDTGILSTHLLLRSPAKVRFSRDCVNGGVDCNTGSGLNPDDDCWDHGTASAAILIGNNAAGDAFRGVTSMTLDSFKIYPTKFGTDCNCIGYIDRGAAERAFEWSVKGALDKVIVAEIEGEDGALGSMSLAANKAFDAGAVVVAANGNSGDPKEPANASRVLGIGSFSVITGDRITTQSQGSTKDGRIKPDLLAPTDTETASTGCDERLCPGSDEAFTIHDGTSGAAPYAAGAAALLRNLVARAMGTDDVDPGFVYALMILSGQRTSFDSWYGVGRLRLPTDGSLLWGVVDVRPGGRFEIPVRVRSRQKIIDAALWWPEDVGHHNNVDLTIDGPNGEHKESNSSPSVFERARMTGAKKGKWRIGIQGKSILWDPQRVYFAILVQP